MRWMENHSRWLAKSLVKNFEQTEFVRLLRSNAEAEREVCRLIELDFEREKQLENEVRIMLDDLEKSQGSSFDRQKMYSMLKNKLAEKKGIVL